MIMVNKAYSKSLMKKFFQGQNQLWFVTLISLFFLFCFFYSLFIFSESNISMPKISNSSHICSGRYIFIQNLPPKFNYNILKNCTSLYRWYNMCPYVKNLGFGPKIIQKKDKIKVLGKRGWFATDQFFLEVIFHNRIKRYDCLTNNSDLASAIFVPFYGGLDLGRHLWDFNISSRDGLGVDLLKWLVHQKEWKKMDGGDHFFVAGRIGWDFMRYGDDGNMWGSNFMQLQSMHMTMLTIESSSWTNQFAIPYPTHFHPGTQIEILQWQNRIRTHQRKYSFAFVGAPRPGLQDSIRGEIIRQCLNMEKNQCKLLHCNAANKCDNPIEVIKVFQDSIFCLQPPGDSYTRRSIFDSILAGCIPVFFHPGSAYVQYLWYFPQDYTKYSVFIPINLVKNGSVSISETLVSISSDQILGMREEVIKLIPKIIYVNPNSKSKNFEDAFDIAVKRVLERIENVRRNPTINFAPQNTWKGKLSLMGQQQWNTYF